MEARLSKGFLWLSGSLIPLLIAIPAMSKRAAVACSKFFEHNCIYIREDGQPLTFWLYVGLMFFIGISWLCTRFCFSQAKLTKAKYERLFCCV